MLSSRPRTPEEQKHRPSNWCWILKPDDVETSVREGVTTLVVLDMSCLHCFNLYKAMEPGTKRRVMIHKKGPESAKIVGKENAERPYPHATDVQTGKVFTEAELAEELGFVGPGQR